MSLAQNKEVQEFLNTVCAQVKWREVHSQIKAELLGHIEDTVEEHLQSGCTMEQAIANALRQMGEPISLGRQLHHTHKPRIYWPVVALACLLLGIGLLTLYSIGMQGLVTHFTETELVYRTLIYAGIGLVVAVGLNYLDYRRLQYYGWYLYGATLALWLLVLVGGIQVNGYPYLRIGPFVVNYTGLTPFLLAVAVAAIFTRWRWDSRGLLKAVVLLMVPNILYLATPSLISIAIYSTVFFTLMLLSGANKWRQILPLVVALLGTFFVFIFSAPYRLARIAGFINPHQDPTGNGYIYIQLREIINAAGMWGQGFTFPAATLPELHTDFVLAYLIYTFGWLGGLIILALSATLIWLMVKLAKEVKDPFGKMLVGGLAVVFTFHFLWSVLMTVGLAPIMWVSLPFISYGGSQIVLNMATIGLVLSVYRRKHLISPPC